jgi:hypothetical protein
MTKKDFVLNSELERINCLICLGCGWDSVQFVSPQQARGQGFKPPLTDQDALPLHNTLCYSPEDLAASLFRPFAIPRCFSGTPRCATVRRNLAALSYRRSHSFLMTFTGEQLVRIATMGDADFSLCFVFRHTTLCHSLEDLAALPPGPRVVLASMGSLETGFSRLLLEEWTKHPGNLIIFPERGQVRNARLAG